MWKTVSAVAATLVTLLGPGSALADQVYPVDGNPDCQDLGLGQYSYKVEPVESGTYDIDAPDGSNTVALTVDGSAFDWSASISMDAVIVKGGPNSMVYLYDPEAYSGDGLTAPINPNTGEPYGLSHVEFCFDYELAVEKTANPSFDRTYGWSIDKTSTVSTLLLALGETYAVPYSVVVDVTGHTDSNFAVSGVVTVHNPAPFDATIASISDALGGNAVALDCGVTFPYVLAAGATLECTYSEAVASSATVRNTVDVVTTGDVGGASAYADADFASATVDAVDECITVSDDHAGALGVACADSAPVTYPYSIDVTGETCGETSFENTASFVANDTAATGSDSWTVLVTVNCELGCTLTPGYWKTHSEYGPAPYDDTWAMLSDGADTVFFLSGQSYYEVLWTSPQGNAYYILAHAFIAAQLNALNGASLGAVQSALDQATAIFEMYTPAQIAAMKGKNGTALRNAMVQLAATIDSYNNGLVGPGHCDESM